MHSLHVSLHTRFSSYLPIGGRDKKADLPSPVPPFEAGPDSIGDGIAAHRAHYDSSFMRPRGSIETLARLSPRYIAKYSSDELKYIASSERVDRIKHWVIS